MLRLFARIPRAGPLDDACLDAHPLFGQALLPDFLKQVEHHRAPTRRIDHAQREQALIDDANGPGQAQVPSEQCPAGWQPAASGCAAAYAPAARRRAPGSLPEASTSARCVPTSAAPSWFLRSPVRHASAHERARPAPWPGTGTGPTTWSPVDRPVRPLPECVHR